VYIEISPPWLHSRKRLLWAIDWFGADRLIFGSDTPYGCRNIARNLRKINKLPISKLLKKQILGQNMAAILKVNQQGI
jgi:predicted TIM-barrel fold metal-dependent hydrolase